MIDGSFGRVYSLFFLLGIVCTACSNGTEVEASRMDSGREIGDGGSTTYYRLSVNPLRKWLKIHK